MKKLIKMICSLLTVLALSMTTLTMHAGNGLAFKPEGENIGAIASVEPLQAPFEDADYSRSGGTDTLDFEITEDSEANVYYKNTGTCDVQVKLLDSSGGVVDSMAVQKGKEDYFTADCTKGDYSVSMHNNDGSTMTGWIKVKQASVEPLQAPFEDADYSRSGGTDTLDFEIREDSEANVYYKNTGTCDVQVKLLDSSGGVVDSMAVQKGKEDYFIADCTKGDYSVSIHNNDGSRMTGWIKVKQLTTKSETGENPNKKGRVPFEDANYVRSGGTGTIKDIYVTKNSDFNVYYKNTGNCDVKVTLINSADEIISEMNVEKGQEDFFQNYCETGIYKVTIQNIDGSKLIGWVKIRQIEA